MQYDPLHAPDPQEWLALDESARLDLVVEYHERSGIELPSLQLHATIHTVVENQVAMGDELPVRNILDRLVDEGLDRHEAIHAIGSVLASHLYRLLRGGPVGTDPHAPYIQELESLTAESWRKSG